jgi:hypothetical protein
MFDSWLLSIETKERGGVPDVGLSSEIRAATSFCPN